MHNGAAPDVRFLHKWHEAKHKKDEGYVKNSEDGIRRTTLGGETKTEGIWINSYVEGEHSASGEHDEVDWDEEAEHPEFLWYFAEHDWSANHVYVGSHNSNREHLTENPESWAEHECDIVDDWEHKSKNAKYASALPTLEEYLDIQREYTFGEYQRNEFGPFKENKELSSIISKIHTDIPHGNGGVKKCTCVLCEERYK